MHLRLAGLGLMVGGGVLWNAMSMEAIGPVLLVAGIGFCGFDRSREMSLARASDKQEEGSFARAAGQT
jgi:hypothetical protein